MLPTPSPPPAVAFWRPTLAATGAIVLAAIPGFLIGSFAPAIKADIGLDETGIGAIFTFGYLVSATVLQFSGALADRRGPQLALRTGLTFAVVGLLLFATISTTFVLILVAFAFNRTAEAIIQPATNTLVSQGVVATRRGTAMGVKQAAVPMSTMLAGLAVPVLGNSLGWRGTFGLVAVIAAPVWFALPDVKPPPRRTMRSKRELWAETHIKLAAIGGGFAAAGLVTAAGFLVLAAKDAGFSDGSAGVLLAVGGGIMIPARLSWGLLADRFSFNRFRAVTVCLACAVVSFLLFSTESKSAIVAGTLLLFGVGWSWPGLFLFAVLEQHPEAPGASTAIVQTGIRVGAFSAPLAFGWLADNRGFGTAWLLPACSAAIATFLVFRASVAVGRRSAPVTQPT